MEKIKVKCPAKINLTLEVLNRRDDGYHNIKSVMQTISLYDYLTIEIKHAKENKINLSGTSSEIPYNEKNLVYKAAVLYLENAELKDLELNINIEKNIPISAGLAGGSTDGAGVLWGLNHIFGKLNFDEINTLCAKLGSDLNVCLKGGCMLATSRGEITEELPFRKYPVTLIKPKNLGISAKEAYSKYSLKEIKSSKNHTDMLIKSINCGDDIRTYLYNDLEKAVFDDYKELQEIKRVYPNAIMSGSGSTYFLLDNIEFSGMPEDYIFINNLEFTSDGAGLA